MAHVGLFVEILTHAFIDTLCNFHGNHNNERRRYTVWAIKGYFFNSAIIFPNVDQTFTTQSCL